MKTRHMLTREDVEKAVLIYVNAIDYDRETGELRLAWKVDPSKKGDDVVLGLDVELDEEKKTSRLMAENEGVEVSVDDPNAPDPLLTVRGPE